MTGCMKLVCESPKMQHTVLRGRIAVASWTIPDGVQRLPGV